MIISPVQTEITPAWVARFETNVQTLIQDSWARRQRSLFWDKIMGVRPSKTGRELFFWLLETAKIVDEGQGGNKRFDDLGAAFFELVNRNSGAGLRLTANEIKDNQMAGESMRGMPPLDFAASWARQVGGHAAYWPQQALVELLKNGTTNLAYDGLPFFSTAHPINGFNAATGTYSNRISGKPLSVITSDVYDVPKMMVNFASVMATARSVLQPNGLPRDVVYKYVIGPPDMQFALSLLFETKTFGGGQFGPNENIVSRWGIEPIIAPELTEAGVCYLVAESLPDEGDAFLFSDREPYVLSTYSPATLAELQRRKEFEWSFDGRNVAAYGHPYLAIRIEAT
jgi:hypothetical protein